MATSDDVFEAYGPTVGEYGAFVTRGANIFHGAHLTGTNCGVVGESIDDSPQTDLPPVARTGVYGRGQTVGVYGISHTKGPDSGFITQTAGVFGTSVSSPGVVGTSLGSFGVWGQLGDSGPETGGAGVFGTSANDIGVVGTTNNKFGVFGMAQNYGPPSPFESATIAGVFGTSRDFMGVLGTSSGGNAVLGRSDRGVGVYGESGNYFGVIGQSGDPAALTPNTAAIFATSSKETAIAAVSDNNAALFAQSGPPITPIPDLSATIEAVSNNNRIGALGISVGSVGVGGFSAANYGVGGLSFARPAPNTPPSSVPAGVYGRSTNGGFGVLGVASRTAAGVTGTGDGHAIGVFGYHSDPGGFAGYFAGNLFVTGHILPGVPFPDGSKRVLHCMESPEHWFEDFGSARLTRGRATVKIDNDFAKVVRVKDYRVFLTPEGDCNGLYIRGKGSKSFEVRELQNGSSSVAFSYRIIAKRKDIKAHVRFAKLGIKALDLEWKARAARGGKAAQLRSSTRAMFALLKKFGGQLGLQKTPS